MKSDLIAKLLAEFEAIARKGQGVEYWFARDLQSLLGYERWENFAALIERARTACQTAGQPVNDHFREVTRMVPLGSGAERAVEDVALTRYGAYLLTQNGDPRKEAIAFAQTYFAVQTRRQELIEARLAEHKRMQARLRLAASEKELSAVIFERLRESDSFARIRNKGDQALFGGLTTHEMKDRLGVPESRPLADFLPTITIHNTKEHDLRRESAIAGEHVTNNTEVRKVLGKRGIKPEELPPAEDLRKVERRLAADEQQLPKSSGQRHPRGKDRGATG